VIDEFIHETLGIPLDLNEPAGTLEFRFFPGGGCSAILQNESTMRQRSSCLTALQMNTGTPIAVFTSIKADSSIAAHFP
jgi:hypothetical protein